MKLHKEFIILDIETTGLSRQDEITEISCIKVDGDTLKKTSEFSYLININGDVSPFITRLTGITKELLTKNGKQLDYVMSKLKDFVGSLPIYAHNASFDKRFIIGASDKVSVPITNEWIDTISIFKQLLPGRKSYKLELLASLFGIKPVAHRGLSDAITILEILKKSMKV